MTWPFQATATAANTAFTIVPRASGNTRGQKEHKPNQCVLKNAQARACCYCSKICIAQAIDLYPAKSRGQREQRDRLQPVMRWSAEQRTADCGGDKYAVLLAPQELCRCTLQLRGHPDVPAVEKRTERVERSTVQPDADGTAELFLIPNCFPAPGQTLCPCNSLRGLGERHAIGISEIEAHDAAMFLRGATS